MQDSVGCSRVSKGFRRMSDRTEDLEGAELDLAVVRALGYRSNGYDDPYDGCDLKDEVVEDHRHFRPSTNWLHGGPIIEREQINLEAYGREVAPSSWEWAAETLAGFRQYGPTPLIAAMRSFVASKTDEWKRL